MFDQHYVKNVKCARRHGLTYKPRTGIDKMENLPRLVDGSEVREALMLTVASWAKQIISGSTFIPIKPPPAKEKIILRDLPGESELNALCWMGIMFSLLGYVIAEMIW